LIELGTAIKFIEDNKNILIGGVGVGRKWLGNRRANWWGRAEHWWRTRRGVRAGHGKAEEEGVVAKDQQGLFFLGQAKGRRKERDGRSWVGGDELLCLVCVLVCVV
jgi:hypothetical protein